VDINPSEWKWNLAHIIGAHVENHQINHFVMARTKVLLFHQWQWKSQKQKQFHGVHASNQPINHFVMERINN
jgi:hypothetical protein